ncbi:MAG: di-trans,poly-cis-decaprenylcistransferase [Thermoleophilia bacterium]|nr:di-trans,poly-cis-decaprenylcistransferase [Thermoleophilia bacterium]
MDGNGRWATRRDLPVTEGHRAGGTALRRATEAALDLHVSELTVYAFSTENWRREAPEVEGIMELFVELLTREVPDLNEEGVRMRFMGRREGLSGHVIERMEWAESATVTNTRMTLTIAFNYGGRAEIVDAARALAARDGADAITEESISAALYLGDLRDPDLIIRTAGEQRTSNFMVWQGAYSELVFTDTLWPDFNIADLAAALRDYAHRERRFGGRDAAVPTIAADATVAGQAPA